MRNYLALGRIFFAIASIASGLLQISRQEFVRLVPKAAASWLPMPHAWAVVTGVFLVAVGLAFAADRARRLAALGLAGLLTVVFLMYVPEVIANPGAGFMWTNPCKTLALLGGVLLLAVVAPAEFAEPLNGLKGQSVRRFGAVAFGVFFVVCGIQHFVYAGFVTQMVPVWLPARSFWTYFTALALIAGGLGVNLPPTARVAALLSGLMIFLWMVLLHLPRAITSWPDAGEIAGNFEALALSGTAFLLAATGRNHFPSPGNPPASPDLQPGSSRSNR